MPEPHIAQLELLSQIDELVSRLTEWVEQSSSWEPMNRARALLQRLLARVETLRFRLEAPLIVATFGGTGTGKSALVNAIVGAECTPSGRERPTTKRPVLILHPKTEQDALGLNLEEFDIKVIEADILRDIVIIDCPDPDSDEEESPGSNIQRLHTLLPHCDLLIYTSTQQKYRSSRVIDELQQAATGCRLLFVQTHAGLDSDIREDWQQNLSAHYEVPDLFFVDSLVAMKEQKSGRKPTGEFGRLLDLISTQLAGAHRVAIRRANLIDLLQSALEHCRTQLTGESQAIEQLEAALEEQRHQLTATMTTRLRDELLSTRNLWERRLLTSVTTVWGFSPFSAILRLYNGLGNFIASLSLFRARNSAQMVLIGAMQGARWFKNRQAETEAEEQLGQLSMLGLDDTLLQESRIVIEGYVKAAKLDTGLVRQSNIDDLRHEATRLEDRFLGQAKIRIEEIISTLAVKNSRFFIRAMYEFLFMVYILFVLYRVGKNFFYDTFWQGTFSEAPKELAHLLGVDFYISAGFFFLIWSGLLVMMFTRRLRRGLTSKIEILAEELARSRIASGVFPKLEDACAEINLQRERLDSLAITTNHLRQQIAMPAKLGGTSLVDR